MPRPVAEPCAGDDDVAVPLHVERQLPERLLDLVGQQRLIAGHALDVHERRRERHRIGSEVQTHSGILPALPRVAVMTAATRTGSGWGLATVTTDGQVLDTWYPDPRLGDLPLRPD